MEAFIEQQKRWNRERNIIAAESRQKAIDRMEKIDTPEKLPEKHQGKIQKQHYPAEMMSYLLKTFQGVSWKAICSEHLTLICKRKVRRYLY